MATEEDVEGWLNEAYAQRYDQPQETCEQAMRALSVAQTQGWGALEAKAHRVAGIGHVILCNFSDAIGHLQEAYKRYQAQENLEGLIETASNIGASYQKMGSYAQALDWDLEALRLAGEEAQTRVVANTLLNVATVYYKLGQYDRALDYAAQCLRLFEMHADLHGLSITLSTIGNCWQKKNDLTKALEAYQKAERNARMADNPGTLAPILQGLGMVHQQLGKDGKALLFYWEALGLQEEIGDRQAIASIYTDMCHVHILAGSLDEAQKYGEKALALAAEIGNRENSYQAHKALSLVFEKLHEHANALQHYKQYHKLQREVIGVQTRMRFQTEKGPRSNSEASARQHMDLLRSQNLEAEQMVYQRQLQIEHLKDQNENLNAALKQIQQIQQVAFASEKDLMGRFPNAFYWHVPHGRTPHTWLWLNEQEERVLIALFETERPELASNTLMAMLAHMFRQILNVHPLSSAAELLHRLETEVRAHEDWVRILVGNPLYVALLVVDPALEELQYAGYGIPLHLFSGGKHVELKGEPLPLGAKGSGKRMLQTRSIPLEDVDRLYLWNHGLGQLAATPGFEALDNAQILHELTAFKGRNLQTQRHEVTTKLESRLLDPLAHTDACVLGIKIGD